MLYLLVDPVLLYEHLTQTFGGYIFESFTNIRTRWITWPFCIHIKSIRVFIYAKLCVLSQIPNCITWTRNSLWVGNCDSRIQWRWQRSTWYRGTSVSPVLAKIQNSCTVLYRVFTCQSNCTSDFLYRSYFCYISSDIKFTQGHDQIYKWKNHFSEMKWIGMAEREKLWEQESCINVLIAQS